MSQWRIKRRVSYSAPAACIRVRRSQRNILNDPVNCRSRQQAIFIIALGSSDFPIAVVYRK